VRDAAANCEDVAMTTPEPWPLDQSSGRVDALLEALDRRILDALAAKATGETIVRLCEARAWLTHPAQPHLTSAPASS
jgi:hypothetical protein